MKKIVLLLFLAVLTVGAYAQKGDLFVGAKGGYVTNYKDALYGFDVAYHLSDPLEVSFTGLMNPSIKYYDDVNLSDAKVSMYSVNLDFRYYMLLQRTWAMGPALGGQYAYVDKQVYTAVLQDYSINTMGFNIGWHMRFNLTENVKLNGGWRYTTANKDASHHLFYIGLGYTFNLF